MRTPDSDDRPNQPSWYDEEAGPLVRLFALTRGRTRPDAREAFDLIALVVADSAYGGAGSPYGSEPGLAPEHRRILDRCREDPASVAEIAAHSDLPVGVVRVLLGDLLDLGLIRVSRPVPPAQLPDERLLREVINGLRAL
ncbi:DUF742 domain-containing protein [Phaeacidiphilus oryzae]|uniref:DUF742 domain-containing protein n=1 Tax=Phaeacidiphilus oryzae TaxID=348818 RepID=UPI000568FA19|nr:DUF742 domain-containing protein [Phaeacidiphilus oryzae]